MNNYRVVLAYSTSVEFEVKAKSKIEAMEKAERLGEKELVNKNGICADLLCRMRNGDVVEVLKR